VKLGSKKAYIYIVNLEEEKDIHNLFKSINNDTKVVDILVHSAGEFANSDLENSITKDFDRLYKVNLKAPYLITRLLISKIKKRHGQVVFINSSVGLRAKAGASIYSSTKHALKALADSLRDEVNKNAVRIISVFPGTTATSMQERITKLNGKTYNPKHLLQPEDVAQILTTALLQPRTAEVTDIIIRPFKKETANPSP
jgi:NADP-dependent 3-hydroxy acid dehydrogenase YdfG